MDWEKRSSYGLSKHLSDERIDHGTWWQKKYIWFSFKLRNFKVRRCRWLCWCFFGKEEEVKQTFGDQKNQQVQNNIKQPQKICLFWKEHNDQVASSFHHWSWRNVPRLVSSLHLHGILWVWRFTESSFPQRDTSWKLSETLCGSSWACSSVHAHKKHSFSWFKVSKCVDW